MEKKRKSLTDVFSERGQELLADALAESQDDLLGKIPAYGLDGKPLHSTESAEKELKKVWTEKTHAPPPAQVDTSRTTEEMILEGRAILKDGSKVTWKS